MAGKHSRNKGREGENQFAKLVGGRRISKIGLGGPDVLDEAGNTYEVKWHGTGLAKVYDALEQAAREGADFVAMRSDHKDWFVAVPLDTWLTLLNWRSDEQT